MLYNSEREKLVKVKCKLIYDGRKFLYIHMYQKCLVFSIIYHPTLVIFLLKNL